MATTLTKHFLSGIEEGGFGVEKSLDVDPVKEALVALLRYKLDDSIKN
jgi:hypothetical protein